MVELTWQGKYDADGKRTAPLRIQLPFQTVETVNESAQQRQMALDMFSAGRPSEWRNRLIWGDKPAAPRFSPSGTCRGGGSGAAFVCAGGACGV